MDGRFPFATLHIEKTQGFEEAALYQERWSGMSLVDSAEYVRRCIVTEGYPHMIDLYEEGH